MKNSLFSIFLFIILLGFLTYTDISFKNLCSEVILKCEEMEKNIDSLSKEENFEKAMDIYTEIMDSDCPIVEYGIQFIKYDAKFPNFN